MKIVVDTNVLMSGLARPKSIPGQIISAWEKHMFAIVANEEQISEIARVIHYPKIRKLLHWDESQIQSFIRQLYLRLEIVNVSDCTARVPTDSADNPILASLIVSDAEVLVSGDSGLLALKDQYPIESPAEFIERM